MNNDRIAAIRANLDAAYHMYTMGYHSAPIVFDALMATPYLLTEIDRLNAELATYKEANPPRVHGEWVRYITDRYDNPTDAYKCSVCGLDDGYGPEENFCPNCGADMRANEAAQAALTCQKCRASGDTKVCVDKTSGYVCPHQAALDGGVK